MINNEPSSTGPSREAFIECFKGDAINCIIQPRDGKGGLYIGNRDAALNIGLLNTHKIRSVLTVDDEFQFTYFNSKVFYPHSDIVAQGFESERHIR